MAKFRKLPIIVDAIKLPNRGENVTDEVFQFLELDDFIWSSDYDEGLVICTLEGPIRANPGDYIIRGLAGEFYPCKPEIFEKSYERVE